VPSATPPDAELCENLRQRFEKKLCYARCGITLVAINLFEPRESYDAGGELEDVFSNKTLQHYVLATDRNSEPPHIFNLASHCYHQLYLPPPVTSRAEPKNSNQAIVITGESGAGKTFNTKKVLDFLADVGSGGGGDSHAKSVTDLMLQTTPLLEGFGNANMPRNPDSSRFGKLYEVYFDKSTKELTGCSISPYMLEKSRVTSQQMNERAFHVFYRMLVGPDAAGLSPKKLLCSILGIWSIYGNNHSITLGLSPKKLEAYNAGVNGYSYDMGRYGLVPIQDRSDDSASAVSQTSDYLYLNGGWGGGTLIHAISTLIRAISTLFQL